MLQRMQVLSVTQLNKYVKFLFEGDDALRMVCVSGELSNFKRYPASGHWYFTLKDADASIPGVMFREANLRLPFQPQDGTRVLIRGRVSLYERDGKYQFYADDMQPDGLGALWLAYEQLKERLATEGLFAEDRKRPLPAIPRRVGVVTSGSGAAVQDICRILGRRFPAARVVLCPVQVQGAGAAEQIAAAIALLNQYAAADVLIVGRGGGSLEELWAFNEEITVRAVADSVIPVISAVGHESDTTLCDFAADLRASTPSAAAELAVPEQAELLARVKNVGDGFCLAIRRALEQRSKALAQLTARRVLQHPGALLQTARQRLDGLLMQLDHAQGRRMMEEKARLARVCARLDTLSPLAVLSRGYALAKRADATVSRAELLRPGDRLALHFADGSATVAVESINLKTGEA
ncbi:MAG: exodeoxyribonuclease VII large subunit [Oscillospiraceae bacterium]|jgi:exodeoxyribonuclease VII large subunit|nr:exodeoxyribonuclease VII large subunit [Oscillospiraceae bacterium]